MKVVVAASDFPLIIAAGVAGLAVSPWWIAFIPMVVASWFINPRWNKRDGWRFCHEQ